MPVEVRADSAVERRRLWMVWIAGAYCAGPGALHLLWLLDLALYQSEQIASLYLPGWFYAAVCLFPISRVAAGILLFSRSRVAAPLTVLAALSSANSLFILPILWYQQTGRELLYSPFQTVIGRLDFVLLLVVAWATFKWEVQGLLGPGPVAGSGRD
jgi:hypothetical protein